MYVHLWRKNSEIEQQSSRSKLKNVFNKTHTSKTQDTYKNSEIFAGMFKEKLKK